jgi:hypothetical protein
VIFRLNTAGSVEVAEAQVEAAALEKIREARLKP